MILKNYLVTSFWRYSLGLFFVLILFAVSQNLLSILGRALLGEISLSALCMLLSLQIPRLAIYLIPMSSVLGMTWMLLQAMQKKELVVLQSSGVCMRRLFSFFVRPILLLWALVAVLNLEVEPWAKRTMEHIVAMDDVQTLFDRITPGRFHALNDGQLVLYAESIDKEHFTLDHVFVVRAFESQTQESKPQTVILAPQAQIHHVDPHRVQYLVLKEGWQYQGVPGQAESVVAHFKALGHALEPFLKESGAGEETLSLLDLWAQGGRRAHIELGYRLSRSWLLVMGLLASLVAVKVLHRGMSYLPLVTTLLFYLAYANIISVARQWMLAGKIEPLVGFLMLHSLVAVPVALLWWHRQVGWRSRRKA